VITLSAHVILARDPNADDAKEAIELAKLVRSIAKKFLGK
jgi:hypothetical protein